MDNTQAYIQMSDHPKIQEYFTNKCGDFICGLGKSEAYNCEPVLGGPNKGKLGFFKPFSISCPVEKHGGHWYYTTAEFGDGWGNCIYFNNLIWLPRQDEIQKMIGDFNKVLPMLPRLERLDRNYDEIFTSMEQLWLAFYMHERHNLTWNGDKWGKGKK